MNDFGRLVIVGFLLILSITPDFVLSGDVQLSIRPRGRIREGDTIHVICETKGKGPFDIVQLVKQINDTEHVITTNNYLKEPFQLSGRYHVTDWKDSGYVELQISHIRGVDAGNIGCKLPPTKKSFIDVIVDVPPSSVELRYQAADGAWYSASDGDRVQVTGNVSCNVTVIGSSFKPEVIISIGEVEVTSRFRRKWFVKEHDDNGFVKMVYSTEYVTSLSDIEAASGGKNLSCVAKTEQHDPKRTSVIIDMAQKPKLTCLKFWHGSLGQRNLTLSCQGRMDPGPERVIWTAGNQQVASYYGSRSIGQHTSPSGRYLTSVATLDSGHLEFRLTIFEVRREDFTEYALDVANEAGQSSETVQLSETNAPAQNMIVQKAHIPETGDSSPIVFDSGASSSSTSLINRTASFLAGAISVAGLFISRH